MHTPHYLHIKHKIVICHTAKVVITANSTPLNGEVLKLKESLEGVLSKSTVEHVLVFKRVELEVPMTPGRDEWLEEVSTSSITV